MTCFLFSHARAIYTRDSGKNTGREYTFSARNALEALAIIDKCRVINSFSKFNLLCEGQKGHNTGQKGLLRVKRDKTRPFRTKGQRGHLFWLFLFWKISRACSLARGYRASFQISMDYEPFTI